MTATATIARPRPDRAIARATVRPRDRDPVTLRTAAGRTAAGSIEQIEPGRLADRLVRYLSSLTVTQGRLSGEPFAVLPWESRFIRGAFKRGVQSAALSIARGNGKTALLSGIAAATLDGPLMVPRGETVIVASSFEQARIAFEHCLAFMGAKLADKRRWRVWDTGQMSRIESRETGARVRCIGSDPRRAHGLAPVLVLADEPAQWPHTTGESMVAALVTAAGKQPHSRFVALGTRPASAEHWFSKLLAGGADYAQSHAAAEGDPLFHRRTWRKANPSLPAMPDLLESIQREAEGAKRDPALLAAFKALRLNLGTHDTSRDLLTTPELWRERLDAPDAPAEGRKTWGIDLGAGHAMSAVACAWETGRLECLAAFGSEPPLDQRALQDGAAGLYRAAFEAGELIVSDRRVPDVAALLGEAAARWGKPDRLVCDRWRLADLRDALDVLGWPPVPVRERGQGYKDGSEDVRGWRVAVAERRVNPVRPSVLLTGALAEAAVMTDPAGNSKLAKGSEGGRRYRAKDDVAAAAILAVAHIPDPDDSAGLSYGGLI